MRARCNSITAQLFNKFVSFVEKWKLRACFQEPATDSALSQISHVHTSPRHSDKIKFKVIIPSKPKPSKYQIITITILCIQFIPRGRDSYGLGEPGFDSRWKRGFPHPPTQPLAPPISYSINNGYHPGVKRLGVAWCWPPTHPSSVEVRERVELYL